MVAGLKAGNRVQGLAKKVLGEEKAKKLFPRTWKKHIVHGFVVKKGIDRKVIVTWDTINVTASVSTRILDNEQEQQPSGAASTPVITRNWPELKI